MIRIFKLVLLLVVSQVAFGQAPSNYTNINGRYRWIAGMFDSTFHIPKGTSPSLRTGGSTNGGGLFYNTSDSSVYTYTGTQWIKARGSINPSDTTNKYVTQVYKKNGSDSVFYVKGGNHLFAFIDSVGSPGGGGGGKIYYFNGGVNMGTIGGLQMYELGDTANTGAAANFTRSTTGNIANFITDPGKPGLVQIPAGVWSVDAWLSETGGGANHAEIWIEVEKWDGSTITTIATSPIEQITEGSTPNLYSWSVSIPTTSLTVTDRIIIQFYISNTNGKTVTLYTQNGYVGEVHTTFTTGIGAINGLTAPAQYLVTGTSGTDFNINSVTATHTFNLPTASATNRGALSTTDWTTFNSKIGGSGTTNYVSKFTNSGTIGNSQIFDNATSVGIGTAFPSASYKLDVNGNINVSNAVNYSQGGTKYGWTYATSGAMAMEGLQGADISLGTGSGAVATERMVIKNSGNVGIGITPDSMFTVAQGTHLQRGVRMSGLPSAVGTKTLRIDASGTVSIADTLANGVSGTGTINRVSKFTASGAIGNSSIRDSSSSVALDISSQGNLGVGYVPNTWFSSVKTIQLPQGSLYSYSSPSKQLGLGLNYYADAIGTERYMENGFASIYDQVNGTHRWYTAPSGIANNQISFTSRMLLQQTGELVLGNFNSDSMLNVQYGAQFGTGVRMSGLPTAPGTRALRINANGTLSVSDTLTNGISGSGTTNYIPKFTSSSAIGNSLLREGTNSIGLGYTPSTWSYTGFQINGAALHGSPTETDAGLSANAYYNSGWKYYANNYASQYRQVNGEHEFNIAGIGTAGNSVSFSTAIKILTSGNVGIGTTNPTYKLDVNGTGRFVSNANGLTLSASTGTSNTQYKVNNTSGDNYFGVAASDGSSLFTGTTAYAGYVGTNNVYPLQFATGGSVRATLDASGNLGLGVTPSAWGSGFTALQVKNATFWSTGNDASITANAYYDGTNYRYIASSASSRTYHNTDGSISWSQAPSGTAGNAISFTQAMTLFSTGNLAVGGTSDNGSRLNVTGSATFSSSVTSLAASGTGIIIAEGSATNGEGLVSVRGKNSSGTSRRADFKYDNADVVRIATASPINMQFETNDITRLTINGSTGAATFSSSVTAGGIVNSPTYFFRSINPATESGIETTIIATGNGENIRAGIFATNNYAADVSTSLIFKTNGSSGGATEQMRITSGGNVLIGSSTASSGFSRLSLVGGEPSGSGANSGVQFTYNSSTYGGGAITTNNAAGGGMTFWTFTGNVGSESYSERMRITSGGEVLLGAAATFGVNTSDGSDNSYMLISGGGAAAAGRGAGLVINGNDRATYGGQLDLFTGDAATAYMTFSTAGTERMRITNGGEVYIGNNPADQGAYNLQVNGTGVWGAGAYVNGSDSALKYNIQPLEPSLDIVKQMKPVTFEYQPFYSKDTTTQTGFIAQDLQRLLADKVYKNGIVKEGGAYLGVAYENIIPLLVKAIQELEAQVQTLKSQLNNR